MSDILLTEKQGAGGSLGMITLNRAKVLNALNHEMIVSLDQQLKKWLDRSDIKGVFIHSEEGKAFCAGGDIRLTYERMKNNNNDQNLIFFREEYQLNRLIYHYPKPYIAFLDGITMGGGVGISIHGSHRIGTERLTFAMPETSIGFFPDVGGTYFLPRLKGYLGVYLGLTGARMAWEDCLFLGITTHKLASQQKQALLNHLIAHEFGDQPKKRVTELIQAFSIAQNNAPLADKEDILNACFKEQTIETILKRLFDAKDAFCENIYQLLLTKSPTSLKVTLHALLQGKKLDFDLCMKQEFRLVHRFLASHDFKEGIRAQIIDKDQSPHWQPPTISEVNEESVINYFAPLEQELYQ